MSSSTDVKHPKYSVVSKWLELMLCYPVNLHIACSVIALAFPSPLQLNNCLAFGSMILEPHVAAEEEAIKAWSTARRVSSALISLMLYNLVFESSMQLWLIL